jgi:hypothetical protein
VSRGRKLPGTARSERRPWGLAVQGAERLRVPVHLQVSQASGAARAAVEAIGGSVTTVYYNKLGALVLMITTQQNGSRDSKRCALHRSLMLTAALKLGTAKFEPHVGECPANSPFVAAQRDERHFMSLHRAQGSGGPGLVRQEGAAAAETGAGAAKTGRPLRCAWQPAACHSAASSGQRGGSIAFHMKAEAALSTEVLQESLHVCADGCWAVWRPAQCAPHDRNHVSTELGLLGSTTMLLKGNASRGNAGRSCGQSFAATFHVHTEITSCHSPAASKPPHHRLQLL